MGGSKAKIRSRSFWTFPNSMNNKMIMNKMLSKIFPLLAIRKSAEKITHIYVCIDQYLPLKQVHSGSFGIGTGNNSRASLVNVTEEEQLGLINVSIKSLRCARINLFIWLRPNRLLSRRFFCSVKCFYSADDDVESCRRALF